MCMSFAAQIFLAKKHKSKLRKSVLSKLLYTLGPRPLFLEEGAEGLLQCHWRHTGQNSWSLEFRASNYKINTWPTSNAAMEIPYENFDITIIACMVHVSRKEPAAQAPIWKFSLLRSQAVSGLKNFGSRTLEFQHKNHLWACQTKWNHGKASRCSKSL